MDHKTSLGSSGGQEQKQRKVVVYPTQRSMSVVKNDSPRFIPHEPVRGAVSPLDKNSGQRGDRVSETSTKRSMEHHEMLTTIYERTNVALTNRLNRVQPLSSSEQVSRRY